MERYARQISLPEFGESGQEKLIAAHVLVVGLGGLGSALCYCLAGMGVGHMTLMDPDTVTQSNLDRQTLYEETDIGEYKALAAARRLKSFNSQPVYISLPQAFSSETELKHYSLVLAATDSQDSRMNINAKCCQSGIPLISGGVNGMYGSIQVVLPGKTPCLRCAGEYGESPASAPTLAPIVTAVSALMAQAAISVLCKWGDPWDDLLLLNGKHFELDRIPLRRQNGCPHCDSSGRGIPC